MMTALAPVVAAGAAPQGADSTFGHDGLYRLDLSKPSIDVANAAVQARGGLIAAGSAGGRFAFAAFDTGTPLFNQGFQQVIVDFGVPSAAQAIIAGSDLTAVGSAGDDFAVARISDAGNPFLEFGDLGRVRTSFGAPAVANAVADLGDGARIVAGTVRSGAGSSVALAEYDRLGKLVPTFGAGGKVVDDLTPGDDVATAVGVSILVDGLRILVAGRAGSNSFVARYRADGTPDPTFGNAGRIVVDLLPGDDVIEQLLVDSGATGSFAVAGSAGSAAYLARFTGTGTAEQSFGDAGVVRASFAGSAVDVRDAIWDVRSSRVTFTAAATGPTGTDAVVARYDTHGVPDVAFGTGGQTVVDLGGANDTVGAAVWVSRGDSTRQLRVVGGNGADMVVASIDYDTGQPWDASDPFERQVVDFGAPTFEMASAMAVQPDGRILLAGYGTRGTILARLLPDGSPDPTFGTAGVSVLQMATIPRAVALVGGRILVLGYRDGGGGILAFTVSGALDTSYGSFGWAASGLDSWMDTSALAVVPDGVLVGGSNQVARLSPSGAPVWSIRLGIDHQVVGLAVQPDGKIAVLARNLRYRYGASLLRLNADGSTDATFSNSTWLVGSPLRADPTALLMLPDGRFVVGARTSNGGSLPAAAPEMVVAGFSREGALDPSFGTGGVTRTPMPAGDGGVITLLRLADGRIMAVGAQDPARVAGANVLRYLPTGQLDGSFGEAGVASVNGADPGAAALTSDGRVLIAGGTINPWDIGLVRARPPDAAAPASFHPLAPVRLLDTRSGVGAPAGKVGPASTLSLQVSGRGGVPTSGVAAVALNVTATGPTDVSFVTAWPNGPARPLASNLNVTPAQTVPNLVVVKVGDGGKVNLYNNAGSTDLVVDLAGWYGEDGGGGGARFNALTPARILDTRTGTGAPAAAVGQGSTLALQVTGRGGVPASGVAAVVLNVTATEGTAESYLTAWPAGTVRPVASNLNYKSGQTVPNLVMVKVGTGGVVDLYNNLGSVHLVADVAGWFGADGTSGGSSFSAVVPARILDTRSGLGGPAVKVGAGGTLSLQVSGQGGVPTSGVTAVIMNITVTEATTVSYLTAWPTGEARPLASNLNYVRGLTVPNLVVVKLGDGGRVNLYNDAGATHVIADVAGWYGA